MRKLTQRLATLTAALSLAFGAISAAEASTISVSTRFYAGGFQASALDYKNTVDSLTAVAPTAGYCDASLSVYNGISNQATCGGGNSNVAFHFAVNFGLASAGTFNFNIGPDFGWGGAVFVDGNAIDFNTNNMWWNGSYTPGQSFIESIALTAGNHTIDVYGVEDCCDGGQQAVFFNNAGAPTMFSARDGLDPISVPEPASLGLLGLALAGLGLTRRRG